MTENKRNIVRFPHPHFNNINDALAACNDGDYFVLHPGVYELSETLRITKSLSLLCVDQATGTPANLKYNGGALKPPLPLLRVENGASVTINGLHLELLHDKESAKRQGLGTSVAIDVASGSCDLVNAHLISSTHGVRVRTHARFNMQGGTLIAAFTGIFASGEVISEGSIIRECHIGLKIDSSISSVNLSSIIFRDCGVGIVCQEHHCTMNIDSSTFDHCQLGLLIVHDTACATPPAITGNKFLSCDRGVILDGEGSSVTVSKNTFQGSSVFGLCTGGGKTIIVSNRFIECATGLEVLGGTSEVRGNACVRCTDVSVFVSGASTRPVVVGNDLAHTTGAAGIADVPPQPGALPVRSGVALLLEDGAAPHVDGNAFRKNKINLWVEDAFGTITGNALETSQHDNVLLVGVRTAVKITSNDIQGSTRSSGVVILDGASGELRRNVIESSAQAAVYLRGAQEVIVEDNEIADAPDAIVVTGQSSGRAVNNNTTLRTEVFSDSLASFTVV